MMLRKLITDTRWTNLIQAFPMLDWESGAWIAGGSARKLYAHQDWQSGDVDVFFRSEAHMKSWQTEFERKLKPKPKKLVIEDYFEELILPMKKCLDPAHAEHIPNVNYQAEKHLETDNAVTYHVHDVHADHTHHVQLIKARYHESLTHLWADFDFTVCCFAADAHEIRFTPAAADHVNQNKLVVQKIINRTNLPLRVIKHMVYGFEPDSQLLKQVSDQIANGDVSWELNY